VELLIRQTLTPQGKSLTGRPVFNITVQGTYNRLCRIPHNGFCGGPGAAMRRGYPTESVTAARPISMTRIWLSCAGLAPVLHLAERAGLHRLVTQHVSIDQAGGGNAHLKVPALVAGMVVGAESIEDMALLRHGAMDRLTTGERAPGGRRRRSGRSCARSPSATSGSSTRSRPGC